jgi:hypothetical protein
MAQGPFYWFDRAIQKVEDGTIKLDGTHTLKAVLATITQPLSRSFLGSSGDARYADLTNELATSNGYTNGGLALSGPTFNRQSTSKTKFTSSAFFWTLTGTVTFKYAILFDFSATNKDLIMVCDMDDSGGSAVALAGILQFSPDVINGWGYVEQP